MNENRVKTEIEIGIQRSIEETTSNPKHGLAVLVFAEWPQSVVDWYLDEIEEVISQYFDTEVYVDV